MNHTPLDSTVYVLHARCFTVNCATLYCTRGSVGGGCLTLNPLLTRVHKSTYIKCVTHAKGNFSLSQAIILLSPKFSPQCD